MKIKLNLIPGYRKQEIKEKDSFWFVLKQGLEILILIFFVIIFIFSFQYILKMEMTLAENSLNYGSKREEFEKIKKYDETFEAANGILNNYEKIQKDQLRWSLLLEKINYLVPNGIILNGIMTKDFKITLSGEALERVVLIKFKENLEKESCFENVNLPLSNLVSKNNVDFQIEFNLKDECIKQK